MNFFKTAEGVLFSLFVLALVVFWVVPNAAHQIMLRDGYYGLAYTEVFLNYEKNCDIGISRKEESEGTFLGIYSYRATLFESCSLSYDKTKKYKNLIIRVRKPWIFDPIAPDVESAISSQYKIKFIDRIYYEY